MHLAKNDFVTVMAHFAEIWEPGFERGIVLEAFRIICYDHINKRGSGGLFVRSSYI